MARRQARFIPLDRAEDPRLEDQSSDLWDPALPEVARDLLSSAVRCFASNGYHGTTTRDITAVLGLSPAALYVHFPSKENVLFEIVRRGHLAALEEIAGAGDRHAADATAQVREVMVLYVAWHARHHVAAKVCQNELPALSSDHYEEILAVRHATNEVFRKAVAQGVSDGAFAPLEVNKTVRAMLSLGIDLVRWYRLDGPDSPEDVGAFYADLGLRIVRAPHDGPRP